MAQPVSVPEHVPLIFDVASGAWIETNPGGSGGGGGAPSGPAGGALAGTYPNPSFAVPAVPDLSGSGSPEGVVAATVGKIYRDTTNGFLYVKRTGAGNTGWVTSQDAGTVSDSAYDATSWDGVTTIAPSKNAVRDKIEALSGTYLPSTSPLAIPGLIAWYSAAQLSGYADGDQVFYLPNSAGVNRPLRQSFGSRGPLYKTGVANGQPCLRFDGVDDVLVAQTAADWQFLTEPHTVIMIAKTTDANPAAALVLFDTSNSTAGIGSLLYYDDAALNDGIKYRLFTTGAAAQATANSAANGFSAQAAHVVVGRYRWRITGNDLTVDVDGVNVAAGDTVADPALTSAPAAALALGAGSNLASFFKGDIFELLFFARPLLDAEITSLLGVLRTTYGI